MVGPHKAELDQVVRRHSNGLHYVFVGYRTDTKSNRYICVETDADGRRPRGPAVMLDSTDFEPIPGVYARTARKVYRKNIKKYGGLRQRGCDCHCCVHEQG